MSLRCQSAYHYSTAELAELMNHSFEDYVVPVNFDAEAMAGVLLENGVDLKASQVALQDDAPVALGLIARRGWTSRLAGMGVFKAARGQGLGDWLMQQLLQHARSRGEWRMELEVIEQNAPAVKLYEKTGFQIQRRLLGFHHTPEPGDPHPGLTAIDVCVAAGKLTQYLPPDTPWQNAGATFVNTGPPYRAFQLHQAVVIVTDPGRDHIYIRSMGAAGGAQAQDQIADLVRALMAQFPQKTFRVSITFPEEQATLFEGLGFEREALSQFQMNLSFT